MFNICSCYFNSEKQIFGIIPQEIAGTGALAFVGSLKAAIGYMVAFDAMFVVASWLLFGFIIKE